MMYVANPRGSECAVTYHGNELERVPIKWGKEFGVRDVGVLGGEVEELRGDIAKHGGSVLYWIHPFFDIGDNPNDEETEYLKSVGEGINKYPADFPIIVFEDRPHLEETDRKLSEMFPGRKFRFLPTLVDGATPDVEMGFAEDEIRELAEHAKDKDFYQQYGWRMKRHRIKEHGTREVCHAKWNEVRSFLPTIGVKDAQYAGRKYETDSTGSEWACVARAKNEMKEIHESSVIIPELVGPKKPLAETP